MDIRNAKELLERLADGINPMTGEVLPSMDACNQPDVIRALHLAVSVLAKAEKEENLPDNNGKPWTPAEEQQLHEEYDAKMPLSEIAKEHGRTRGAIQSRLVKMGLLPEKTSSETK